jgi:tRNA (guanine-N7-)-methyltransferase
MLSVGFRRDVTGSDAAPPLRWYGRRGGHRLRKGRRDRLERLLPALRLTLPESDGTVDLAAAFGVPPKDVWLEVGFGAGEHLAAQAGAHPETAMVGCEPYVTGVASLLSIIESEGLTNIRIFDDDARRLLGSLPEASIGRVFVLFPDPWPKSRHHKRRFIAPQTLDALARVMKDGAELRFATDHMGYVRWTLDHVLRNPAFAWLARRPTDWRRRPSDGFETRYERKAAGQDLASVHLGFRRHHRDRAG